MLRGLSGIFAEVAEYMWRKTSDYDRWLHGMRRIARHGLGEFISGRNYAPVNWARSLDEDGRPIYAPEARYWEQPAGASAVTPGRLGAHGWDALAFDPGHRLLFIPSMTMPALYATGAAGGMMADLGVSVDGGGRRRHTRRGLDGDGGRRSNHHRRRRQRQYLHRRLGLHALQFGAEVSWPAATAGIRPRRQRAQAVLGRCAAHSEAPCSPPGAVRG